MSDYIDHKGIERLTPKTYVPNTVNRDDLSAFCAALNRLEDVHTRKMLETKDPKPGDTYSLDNNMDALVSSLKACLTDSSKMSGYAGLMSLLHAVIKQESIVIQYANLEFDCRGTATVSPGVMITIDIGEIKKDSSHFNTAKRQLCFRLAMLKYVAEVLHQSTPVYLVGRFFFSRDNDKLGLVTSSTIRVSSEVGLSQAMRDTTINFQFFTHYGST
eukprot:GILJ01010756.1.p1 GENE.GILJ01010756.1~~GILJ01010756.1.p1  ORF type:complete len:216 (+),score=23.63 GILJ01010756.1:468-1115(+)